MVAAFKNHSLQSLGYADSTNEEDAESEFTTDSAVNDTEDEEDDEDLDVQFESKQCISNEISNFEQTEVKPL